MYKMNRKQLDRLQKTFALATLHARPPPPALAQPLQLPLLRKPRIQFLLAPALLVSALTLYYHSATYDEITPLEHQKIMSTSV